MDSNKWYIAVVELLSGIWLLWPYGLLSTKLLCPWDFPGKNLGEEWVYISLSRGSSLPKDWIHAFCISGVDEQIFYHCATWEDLTNGIDDLICKTEIKLRRTYIQIPRGKEGWGELRDWDWGIYTNDAMYKIDNRYWEPIVQLRELLPNALWWPKWEANSQTRTYRYTHSWFTLLYSRN